jgi:hypothetical protein
VGTHTIMRLNTAVNKSSFQREAQMARETPGQSGPDTFDGPQTAKDAHSHTQSYSLTSMECVVTWQVTELYFTRKLRHK